MGGDSVAAAVSESFSVILFLHSADASQDAASGLPAAGITALNRLIITTVYKSTEPQALTGFLWRRPQGMLGTQDLGQFYFETIKDKHGSALLVLLKDMNTCPNLDGARWMQLGKLQLQRKSISSPEEPTALDMLLITLHVSWVRQNLGLVLKTGCVTVIKQRGEGVLAVVVVFVQSIVGWICYPTIDQDERV